MKGICRFKRPESQHVVKCSTRMRDIREWNRVRVSLVRRSNTFTLMRDTTMSIIQPLTADGDLGAKYAMYAAYNGPSRFCRVIPGTAS
jgi:hypothetical protein